MRNHSYHLDLIPEGGAGRPTLYTTSSRLLPMPTMASCPGHAGPAGTTASAATFAGHRRGLAGVMVAGGAAALGLAVFPQDLRDGEDRHGILVEHRAGDGRLHDAGVDRDGAVEARDIERGAAGLIALGGEHVLDGVHDELRDPSGW